ncbi:MAG TPA: peptidyl-prolyl cis-trans isomerase [Polyangiaceae bacterium]|nr:peptidyl-prolyl cis-trans isomerase [Polyangiaceae bacterium]
MKHRAWVLGASAWVIAMLAIGGGASAQPQSDPNAVVAKVGSATITVGELERRMARMPRFQLASLGDTPEAVRRAFLERVLIPEHLMAQGARAAGLDKEHDARVRERDVLKSAALKAMRAEDAAKVQVTDAEVAKYYTDNRVQFDTPARFAVWRILLPTRADAEAVLAEARKDPTPKAWNELARKRSMDKATALKGGNLGFITSSEESADGKLRVDKALVDAVKAVKDGELVSTPIAEGPGWAVVWRRSSLPEMHRTLEQESAGIRQTLQRERALALQDKAIAALKDKYVSAVTPSALELLEVTSSGQLGPRGKPGRVYRKPVAGPPESTPRGVR